MALWLYTENALYGAINLFCMRKTRIIYKLKKAFRELGIKLTKDGYFYEFEYEHLFLLLSVDNGSDTFAFVAHVLDTQNCLNEEQLKIALDVVDGIHKNYYGEWNNGVPYFASPEYFIGQGVEVTGEWLAKQLKEFWDAYMFLQANIHLMGDASIMKYLETNK